MAAHDAFHIFRRFSGLRTRLLLLAQDEIVDLEEQLNLVDHTEKSPLFLASRREDKNEERKTIISKLRTSLAAYDELLEGSQRALAYERPHEKYTSSLQHWLAGNACIARKETAFLKNDDDLLTLSSMEDGVVKWLERTVCDKIVCHLGKGSEPKSRDPRVHIFPRSSTVTVARAILSPLIAFLLLAPVVICNLIESMAARLVVMVGATVIFVLCVCLLTNARTVDLAVAGATYTTIMVVFIEGKNTVAS
ncbi:hypothetical protein B0J15DRAFT_506240 [Fusarium solani]|uniref:DUF6594 domain-containing protein n=1 Tax=Fusarium solani TaxID=169388 RepID=A0A9P9G082_FUSSL|nr:uncharacterized protein B0J15DRAFT_506240 [Fusarium solani]KAH7230719.1 hypothetical protein B0J15DRAFT_506240 [Fusarium solani]